MISKKLANKDIRVESAKKGARLTKAQINQANMARIAQIANAGR